MNRLFWGFLFVVLDYELKIGSATLGLLPDFGGYFLLMKGMESLADENEYFARGRHWAFGLMLLHLVLYGGALLDPPAMTAVGLWVLGLAGHIVGLYLVNRVIAGIRQMESSSGRDLQSEKLKFMWLIQAVMGTLAYLLNWVPLVKSFAALASAVTGICLLIAMYGTKKRYEEREK